jgi:Zn finger protein HypA/HybF involved in hydrogenase expression
MAIFMEEETHRLKCPHCQNRTFYEKPVYAYIKSGNDLQATLDKTQFICVKCDKVAHEIKAGKGTIKR